MKKDIECLLLFLIPAIFLERLLAFFSSVMFSKYIGHSKSSIESIFSDYSVGDIFTITGTINAIALLLPCVVLAVWVWKIEKRVGGRYILWALGALVLKYWFLVLYIGQRLYEKDKYDDVT